MMRLKYKYTSISDYIFNVLTKYRISYIFIVIFNGKKMKIYMKWKMFILWKLFIFLQYI